MLLALNLAALGTGSVLINREAGPRPHPKGSTQNCRTMEHYRRLGIVAPIRGCGLPPDLKTDVTYYTSLTGWELARLPMPSEREKLAARRNAPADDQVVEPIFRCNQMHAEAALFEQVRRCRLVELRFGWECVSWSEQPDGVTVSIEEVAGGRRETLRGAYLAGCDAAHGVVRRHLGIAYQGETPTMQPYLGGPMVSSYLRAPEPGAGRARPLLAILGGEPQHPQQHRGGGRRKRVSVQHAAGTPDQVPDEAMIAAAFRASVGRDIAVRIHRPWDLDGGPGVRRRAVRRRARLDGRGCGAPVHTGGRLRHEHRHGRRQQSRLETRRHGAGLGRFRPAGKLRSRASSDRVPQHRRRQGAGAQCRRDAGASGDRRGLGRGRGGPARSRNLSQRLRRRVLLARRAARRAL